MIDVAVGQSLAETQLVEFARGKTAAALPQAHRRQGLAASDGIHERRTDLLDEALPILGIGQALRGELGGAQLKVRPGELRVLLHGLPGIHGDSAQEARSAELSGIG